MRSPKIYPHQPSEDRVSFDVLIARALPLDTSELNVAKTRLRTTYLKKDYRKVFPPTFHFRIKRGSKSIGSRERGNDYWFLDTKESRVFVRNLWFLHQFFPRPKSVLAFLNAETTPATRQQLLDARLKEITALSTAYSTWMQATGTLLQHDWAQFEPTEIDLSEAIPNRASAPQSPQDSKALFGAPAVADFIREIEERASYQSGSSSDAAEKALYFIALGRHDIARSIVAEAMNDNPADPIVLFANAVLHLEDFRRHQERAFSHDLMHSHLLAPVDAEEMWHAEAFRGETVASAQAEEGAFDSILRAWHHWPRDLRTKCSDVSPDQWLVHVESWLDRALAARISFDERLSSTRKDPVATQVRQSCRDFVRERWNSVQRHGLVFQHTDEMVLLLMAASVLDQRTAREIVESIRGLDNEPATPLGSEGWMLSASTRLVIPVTPQPSPAEIVHRAMEQPGFLTSLHRVISPGEVAALEQRLRQMIHHHTSDRSAIRRTLATRNAVEDQVRSADWKHAIATCDSMESTSLPTESSVGKALKRWWQYATVRMRFDAAWTSIATSDTKGATELMLEATERALAHFDSLAGDLPLARLAISDDVADEEIQGDLLFGQANILTDCDSLAWMSCEAAVASCDQPHAIKIVSDIRTECSENSTPPFLAFGKWLAATLTKPGSLHVKLEKLENRIQSWRQLH